MITYSTVEYVYANMGGIEYDNDSLDSVYENWLLSTGTGSETENAIKISESPTRGVTRRDYDGTKTDWTINNLGSRGYTSEEIDEPYETFYYYFTTLKDNYVRTASKVSEEVNIKIKDSDTRKVAYSDSETKIKITEKTEYRNVKRSLYESIKVSESSTRKLNRRNSETKIFIMDEGSFTYVDTDGNSTTVEQIEIGGSINLFDFELYSSPLTQSDFSTWVADNAPINYNALRPFIPGEYEYTNAYAGFVLSLPPNDGRYGVTGSTVWIDVEDTVEKGTSTGIAGALTRVSFAKRFYTPPHIMTAVNYATENCYVEVKNVTVDYFDFGLKSITSGEYLEGEINWLADGY